MFIINHYFYPANTQEGNKSVLLNPEFSLQMYKVFFKDRLLILTNRIETDLTTDFNAILKYSNQGELKTFLNNFEQNEDLKTAIIYWHNQHQLLQKVRDCYKNILAAGGLVWNAHHKQFLIFKRLGMIDLPKGKVDKGETFEEAALREVEEECGLHELKITNKLATTFHTYRLADKIILKETRWFEMTYHGTATPTPQTEENIEAVWWINPEDFKDFAAYTYPSIREVLKKSSGI